ncbi:DUF1501 domain-containing protein [Rhodobium gokarnense]|uniref:Uncharacterized protein (DUF1501 family) n=1 Tax=Rhodobium gokarnense TaxID=364296 RepID=A0ABT3H5X6_9HYPH|nr:DUF1501 domain-containing protein [Rhodobium gokarnense]MCW2305795.1 uncharacterized protein (DUF1501 family) [Rhodobium gokarnense]
MAISDLSRRQFLAVSGGLAVSPFLPGIAAASGRDPRFLTGILRGGVDGLAVVAPVGDPDYQNVREGLAFARSGPNSGLPLDGFFALNPNMKQLAELYRNGEALFVHAVATPYRERSHFDGQDVLESGLTRSGRGDSGWLNRALEIAAAKKTIDGRGFAMGAQLPLVMRGSAPVLSWMPPGFATASADTRLRLLDIYTHADPTLAAAIAEGMELDDLVGGEDSAREVMRQSREMGGGGKVRSYRMTGTVAGKVMSDADGPRVGAFSLNGWDTHANERPFKGRLGRQLEALDATIGALKSEMAPVWKDTVVALVTEFGRTARMNGTSGTDHGTATLAILVGGAVNGGRVIADWPGLSDRALYDGRDLAPTTDLRAILKGVIGDHLGVSEAALGEKVFPGSRDVRPMRDLIA